MWKAVLIMVVCSDCIHPNVTYFKEICPSVPQNLVQDCSFNTHQKSHLHTPSMQITKYQKGVHYMGVKIFNKPSPKIQYLSSNKKQFHKSLKKCLLLGSFYMIEEFYNWSSTSELYAGDLYIKLYLHSPYDCNSRFL
jgi:hypothetical protein